MSAIRVRTDVPARGRAALAALAAFALVGAAAAMVASYVPHNPLTDGVINPYHVVHYAMFDSRGQILAHRLLVAGVIVAALLAAVLRRTTDRAARALDGSRAAGAVLWSILAAFALASAAHFAARSPAALGAAAIAAAAVALRPGWLTAPRSLAWGIACLAIVVIATAPGILVARDLSFVTAQELTSIQWHYDYSMGAGDRLAAGQPLFSDVRPSLGLLPAILLGGWQRAFGTLDLGARQDLVRWLALGFFVAALLAYRRHAGGRNALAVAGLLFLVPWLHFASPPGASFPSLLYPNQSAWRSAGFVLAPLGLLAIRRARLVVQAAVVGALSAVVLLLNTESGIALAVGAAVFLAARVYPGMRPRRATLARAGAAAAASFVAVVAAALATHRALLGSWPNLALLAESGDTVAAFSHGYGGFRMSWDPVALLLAFHAAYLVVWTALSRRRSSSRGAFRLAVATSILVWFAYYANRAAAWNLWTLLALYAFLAADILAFVHRRRAAPSHGRLPLAFSGIALACVLLPHVAFTNALAVHDMWTALDRLRTGEARAGSRRVSGVDLPIPLADELEARAALVRRATERGPPAMLSACSYLVSTMTGVYSPLPFGDAFNEVFTPALYDRLLASIRTRHPAYLLFDAPTSLLVGSELQVEYFAKLRRDISPWYRPLAGAGGWEIWTPTQEAPVPPVPAAHEGAR